MNVNKINDLACPKTFGTRGTVRTRGTLGTPGTGGTLQRLFTSRLARNSCYTVSEFATLRFPVRKEIGWLVLLTQ